MMRIALCASLLVLAACSTVHHLRTVSDAPGVEWSCAPAHSAAETMTLAIRDAMERDAADTVGGAAFRAEYGMRTPRDISIITDPSLCALAGRAYVEGKSLPPARYQVALVRVGRRYVAINMNAIQLAGEFMVEAELDMNFRIIGWIGT